MNTTIKDLGNTIPEYFRPQGALPFAPAPRQPSLDPISDAIRDHYLAQSRSADQVRRIKEFDGEDFITISGPAW